MNYSNYKVLVFDLDDTLIDTSKILVPEASKNSCNVMIAHGLKCDLNSCINLRNDLASHYSKMKLFEVLVEKINGNSNKHIAQAGFDLFYNPKIPSQLTGLNNSKQVTDELRKKYKLYILTAGIPKIQKEKINALSFKENFKNFYFCDITKNENKKDYLAHILKNETILPQELLCIGNRYDDEIAAGIELNCHTCWIPYGEHDIKVVNTSKSLFHCESINELIETCKL